MEELSQPKRAGRNGRTLMFLPVVMLLASFGLATLFSLVGAYLVGGSGAILGMILGLVLSFVLMARHAGR